MSSRRNQLSLLAAAFLLMLSGCGGGGGNTGSVIDPEPIALAGVSSNHGLAPLDAFTVQPGATQERGNVEVSCPAGGAACVLSVAADGTVEYARTGGMPSVMSASMALAGLSSNHGLAPLDAFTVPPGATQERGNVEVSCPAGGAACVLSVAADGTVEYARTGGMPSVMSASMALAGLSSNHGLAPLDAFTVPPGATQERGNVEVSCPAGGAACVLSVAADGTVEYARTGGMPSVMSASMALAGLSSNHGLAPLDAFTVPPGATQERGNVEVSCPAGGAACVLSVAADGTVEYARTGGMPSVMSASMALAGLSSNHGLAPLDAFTVPPGATQERGNVEVSCPAGGAACVLSVAADGTVEYARTGGMPSVMSASMALAGLSSNHGLAPLDAFTVPPGATQERGNVEVSCPAGGAACVLSVAADGTVEYARTGGMPSVGSASMALAGLSSNHGLAPLDAFTVPPGATQERGNVEVSCPAGGAACVLSVAADGTVEYARTGGMPSVMSAREFLEIPSVHGLTEGLITVQSGASKEHGNVILSCPASEEACVLTVATDGMVTYARTGGTPTFMLIPPEEFPELPLWRPVHAAQAPTIDNQDTLHVGANVASLAEMLTPGESYGGIATSSGWVKDGTSADRVVEFLGQHVGATTSEAGGGYTFTLAATGLPTFSEPPTVRVASGTSDEFVDHAVRAVQLINAALPYEQRIVFSSDRAPPLAAIEDISDGEIFVDFAASADDWNLVNRDYRPGAAAIAQYDPIYEWDAAQQRSEHKGMRAAHVWFDLERIMNAAWVRNPDTGEYEETVLDMPVTDPEIRVYSEADIFSIIVHELLHELGFLAHNDGVRFEDSLMRGSSLLVTQTLPAIDSDALLAAYDRLEPGTEPEELSAQNLGPWTDTSFHVRGDFDFPGGGVSFGVASRNGRAQPWASGPTPWTELTDNPELSGAVTWSGALLGITPSDDTVSGSTRLTIELSTLSGQQDFTRLESWGTNSAPGAMGQGTLWGDGDLSYSIEVHGNSFVQNGGDEGEVTGTFMGAAHEAMGGVLERTDLAAGFGGMR